MSFSQYIILSRTDENGEVSKLDEIYNLKPLSKLKLNQLQKQVILTVVKKMILSANFENKWRITNSKTFMLATHIILSIIGLIKGISNGKENTDITFKVIIANLFSIPFWLFVGYYYIYSSYKLHNIQNKLSIYLLNNETLYNDFFSFEMCHDFSIKITDKKMNSSKNFENINEEYDFFSYFICFNIAADYHVLYKKAVPVEDLKSVEEVFKYIDLEVKDKAPILLKECIFPFFVLFIVFFIKNKGKSYFLIRIFVFFIIGVAAILLKERSSAKVFKNKFQVFMDKLNNEKLIQNGRFGFRVGSLFVICGLNDKGKMCCLKQLNNAMNKLTGI